MKLFLISNIVPPSTDSHSALMDSIIKGTKLRRVDAATEAQQGSGSGDARSDLLSEIRQGVELKPAAERELNNQGNSGQRDSHNRGTDALANALRNALAARHIAIQPSSSSSSDNEDWDD